MSVTEILTAIEALPRTQGDASKTYQDLKKISERVDELIEAAEWAMEN